jgi:hypothetical protein
MHTRTISIIDGELAILRKGIFPSELNLFPTTIKVQPGFNPAEPPYLVSYEYYRNRADEILPPRKPAPADNEYLLLAISCWNPTEDPKTSVSGFDEMKVQNAGQVGQQFYRAKLVVVNPRSKLSVDGFRKSVSGELVPVKYELYWDGSELRICGPFGESELVDNLDYGMLAALYGKDLITLEPGELNTFVYAARTLAHKALRDNNHPMALESLILALRAAYANPADMSDCTRKIRLSVHEDLHRLVAS